MWFRPPRPAELIGRSSLHDADELRESIAGAGFPDVAVAAATRTLRLPAPADFLWQYVHSTPLAQAVAEVDRERHAALERDVVQAGSRSRRRARWAWSYAARRDGARRVTPAALRATTLAEESAERTRRYPLPAAQGP